MHARDPGDSEFPSAESELGRLVADLCSGTATAADQARLDRLLESPEHRRAYVALMQLHGELLWRWRKTKQAVPRGDEGGATATGRQVSTPDEPEVPPRRGAAFAALRRQFAAWAGTIARLRKRLLRPEVVSVFVAAAVVASGLVAANYSRVRPGEGGFGGRSSRGPFVAEITGLHRVRWADPRRAPPPLWLSAGTMIDLESGLLELTHACGAKVVVEGPALVKVESASSLRLVRGVLSARYDRMAKTAIHGETADAPAFVVQTPTADVIDLGTEFGVGVGEAGATQVHVFDGLVEIAPVVQDRDRGPTRLAAGDAARIDGAGHVTHGPVPLARKIIRRLPGNEPPPEWVEEKAMTLIADGFDGAGELKDTPPAARGGVGGAAWIPSGDGWRLDGGRLRPVGTSSAALPLNLKAGAVYRISVEIDLPAGDAGWVALGFNDQGAPWATWFNGCAWTAQRATVEALWGGNVAYGGPGNTNRIADIDSRFGRHVRMVQLDTRGRRWKATYFCDGVQVAWYVFPAGPLPIQSVWLHAQTAPTAAFENFRVAVYHPAPQPEPPAPR